MEYIIVNEDPEQEVKKINTNDEVELIEHFGLSHYTILRLKDMKIEFAHWTYNGVEWLEPIDNTSAFILKKTIKEVTNSVHNKHFRKDTI